LRRKTIRDFIRMKNEGKKIVMITAYDYMMAKLVDEAGVDGILIGDSLGNVILGYESTLSVTMDEMIHHTKAVARAKPKALVVGDMPFLSYQVSKEDAILNAGRFIRAGADAVKIEGGLEVLDKIEAIIKAGIPVMGHVGLTPQRVLQFGGYRLMGKNTEEGIKIIEDAKALEEVGVFSIVVEFTTTEVAKEVTKMLKIPTICIGCGVECDGQILVLNDIIGLSPYIPSFVKKYADVSKIVNEAVTQYINEVRSSKFPDENYTRHMNQEEYKIFLDKIRRNK